MCRDAAAGIEVRLLDRFTIQALIRTQKNERGRISCRSFATSAAL